MRFLVIEVNLYTTEGEEEEEKAAPGSQGEHVLP